MPRFVILLHQTPPDYPRATHFDLLLEHQGALRTWALPAMPLAGQSLEAEQLADHRIDYLTFEGELTGGRGVVRRVAGGEYEVAAESPASLTVCLRSDALTGTLTLVRSAGELHLWRVSFAA